MIKTIKIPGLPIKEYEMILIQMQPKPIEISKFSEQFEPVANSKTFVLLLPSKNIFPLFSMQILLRRTQTAPLISYSGELSLSDSQNFLNT
jgi:hypothetical protein